MSAERTVRQVVGRRGPSHPTYPVLDHLDTTPRRDPRCDT